MSGLTAEPAKSLSHSCSTVVVGGHFALSPHGIATTPPTSQTELATFRNAVAAVAEYAGRNRPACLKLLIGDLELPQAQRRDLGWAVPASYRTAIEAAGLSDIVIVAESRCRNFGTKKVVAGLKKQLQALGGERLYAESGLGLMAVGEGDDRALYLIADVLLDEPGPHEAAIALTRPGSGIPTCPVLAAGALVDMAASGTRHYQAFYDSEDDPGVEKKLIEGVYAAGLGIPGFGMTCDIVISSSGMPHSRTLIETEHLRRPGRRPGLEALVRDVRRAMRSHSAWMFSEPHALTV